MSCCDRPTSRTTDRTDCRCRAPSGSTTVVTGVSAGSELFERAIDAGAELVLVHHGLLWKGPPRPLDRAAKRRLKLLFDADIALAAYHLPLDAHLEHGNNALLADAIGATTVEPFAGIGVAARFAAAIAPDELRGRLRAACGGREPLAILDGPAAVETVGSRIRRRPGLPRRRHRRRPRRVRHRRGQRAQLQRSARGRRALPRLRPLRDRDARRAPARRPAGGEVRCSSSLRRRRRTRFRNSLAASVAIIRSEA